MRVEMDGAGAAGRKGRSCPEQRAVAGQLKSESRRRAISPDCKRVGRVLRKSGKVTGRRQDSDEHNVNSSHGRRGNRATGHGDLTGPGRGEGLQLQQDPDRLYAWAVRESGLGDESTAEWAVIHHVRAERLNLRNLHPCSHLQPALALPIPC